MYLSGISHDVYGLISLVGDAEAGKVSDAEVIPE